MAPLNSSSSKISVLVDGGSPLATDLFVVARGNANRKITGANLTAGLVGTYVRIIGDDMTGKLGITVTTATTEALEITSSDGSVVTPIFQVSDSTSPNIQQIRFWADGSAHFNMQNNGSFTVDGTSDDDMISVPTGAFGDRVGIGTNAPTARLYITGSTSTPNVPVLRAESSDGDATTAPVFAVTQSGSDVIQLFDDGRAIFNILGNNSADFRVASDTEANMFLVDAGLNMVSVGAATVDLDGRLHVKGESNVQKLLHIESDDTGTTFPALHITEQGNDLARFFANGAVELVESAIATPIAFRVGSGSNWLVVNGLSGNVGLGAVVPAAELEISKADATPEFRITPTIGSAANSIIVLQGYRTGIDPIAYIAGRNIAGTSVESSRIELGRGFGGNDAGEIRFLVKTQAGSLTDAMTIYSDGDVGIGTTAPGVKLDIVGGFIRNDSGYLGGDNVPYYMGSGNDARFYYNGVNLICEPDFVGSGEFHVQAKQLIEIAGAVDGALEVEQASTASTIRTHIKMVEGSGASGSGIAIDWYGRGISDLACRINSVRQAATQGYDFVFSTKAAAGALAEVFRLTEEGYIGVLASLTGDTAPNDDTTNKTLSIQKLAAPPTNAAYIAFANNPGTDTFYLVMQEL